MLSSSSYVLDLQSILDLMRVLGFFFLLLIIITVYVLQDGKLSKLLFPLIINHYLLDALSFFFFFGFHNSVLPLCTFGCPSLSCMIGLLFSPIVFGTCPLKPAFSLGTSALSFGNKTVQIPNCYPVVSVHRHL